MGRGRQKAKHQKVARALKYHQTPIDVSALERELSARHDEPGYDDHYGAEEDAEDSEYADRR